MEPQANGPSGIGAADAGVSSTQKTTTPPVLGRIVNAWMGKVKSARRSRADFDRDAAEGMSFYTGDTRQLWKTMFRDGNVAGSPAPTPSFLININKAFEAVAIFGAVLYNHNPKRNVTPRQLPMVGPEVLGIQLPQVDPNTGMSEPPDEGAMAYMQTAQGMEVDREVKQTQADLVERYLNYTPGELDLRTQARKAVDEAMITGAGVMWTEAVTMPADPPNEPFLMVGSFYDSIANLYLDADATDIDEIHFCARRVTLPREQVARQFGIPKKDLTPNTQSEDSDNQNSRSVGKYPYESQARRQGGKTTDLVTYFQIYSKIGVLEQLKGSKKKTDGGSMFDAVGDYAYICVSDSCPYPLNIPPAVLDEQPDETGFPQSLRQRLAWPIPFWADNNGWPFEMLAFNPVPNSVWPMSLIRPGIGELRFINYCISWLATRITSSCQTMIGVSKAADEDIKQQILADSKFGFKIVEISQALGQNINELMSVFQSPQVNQDIWQILDRVMQLFDKRVGLTELMYGQTTSQMRSATEASVKGDAMQARPADMLDQVTHWGTRLSRKEALAARWLLRPNDVMPIMGPLGSMAWQQHLSLKPGEDPAVIAREFEYTIETDAGRKLNKTNRANSINTAMQTLMPMLMSQAQATNNYDQVNGLIKAFAETLELDPKGMMLQPLPPPPMPPMAPAGEAPPDEGTPPAPDQA